MTRWLSVVGAGLLALAPLVLFAEGESPDTASAATDCHLVGVRILTDDLNGAHRVCRQADGSTTVGAIEAVPESAPPQTEAPTQYFPLDESAAD